MEVQRNLLSTLEISSFVDVVDEPDRVWKHVEHDGDVLGVTYSESSAPLKKMMLSKAMSVPAIRETTVSQKNRCFITRMRQTDGMSPDSPVQVRLHKDELNDGPCLTWVYVLYDVPGVVQRGKPDGSVLYSCRTDGNIRKFVGTNGKVYPRSGSYWEHFPESNSSYYFPGSYVEHGVRPVTTALVQRFTFIIFMKLRVRVDTPYVHRWIGKLLGSPTVMICDMCGRVYTSQTALTKHVRGCGKPKTKTAYYKKKSTALVKKKRAHRGRAK